MTTLTSLSRIPKERNRRALADYVLPDDWASLPEIPAHRIQHFYSQVFDKDFILDIYLPLDYQTGDRSYSLVLCNDGQDMPALDMGRWLHYLQGKSLIKPVIWVAIHINRYRKLMYGVSGTSDYAGRGAWANDYQHFLIEELLPWLQQQYRLTDAPEARSCVGFSLGGLMAFDTVYSRPDVFRNVGVFSGSFWWRGKDYKDGYTDADRLMHQRIKALPCHPALKVWLQTGTLDETNDRDEDGIIDSIHDSWDIYTALQEKGLSLSRLHYLEVVKGEHTQATWKMLMGTCLHYLLLPTVSEAT